eukprot:maker-scaffold_15-snap-gene-8.1-mRNA-1 protein AED:0.23 eAED:0.27 QI:0/0/0/0.5/1/1/2/0/1256
MPKRSRRRNLQETTQTPSFVPSNAPSLAPSFLPTTDPTISPSTRPTESPSRSPTKSPTDSPTLQPTGAPTNSPSISPTQSPTRPLRDTFAINTLFQRDVSSSWTEREFDHVFKCFINFMLGQIDSSKYYISDLGSSPYDPLYPESLVPLIELSEECFDPETPSDLVPCDVSIYIHTSNGESGEEEEEDTRQKISLQEHFEQLVNTSRSEFYSFSFRGQNEFLYRLTNNVTNTDPVSEAELLDDNNFCTGLRMTMDREELVPTAEITEAPVAQIGNGGSEPQILEIYVIIPVSLVLVSICLVLFLVRMRKKPIFVYDDFEDGAGKLDSFVARAMPGRALSRKYTSMKGKTASTETSEAFGDDHGHEGENGKGKPKTIEELLSTEFAQLRLDLSSLQLEKVIGHGSNGRIFRASYAGSKVAVKELYAEQIPGFLEGDEENGENKLVVNKRMENTLREVKLLRMLRHPHIIQLFGCSFQHVDTSGVWRFYIVMELAKCNLSQFLSDETSKTELPVMKKHPKVDYSGPDNQNSFVLLTFARQICAGCAHIHDNNMCHFDIKPQNILLDSSGQIKICDLGIAKLTTGENKTIESTISNNGGTPPFMSPELLKGDIETIGPPVDVYAFGIVLWQLFHRSSPQPTEWSIPKLFNEVLTNNYRPQVTSPNMSFELINLMKACWDSDPAVRPKFTSLMVSFDKFLFELLETIEREEENSVKSVERENFETGEYVTVWDYGENDYLPAKVLSKYVSGEEVLYDVLLLKENMEINVEKREGIPATDLLKSGNEVDDQGLMATKRNAVSSGLSSTGNHSASTGRTINFVASENEKRKKKELKKTYVLKEGKVNLQGLVVSDQGVSSALPSKEELDQLSKQTVTKQSIHRFHLLGTGASGAVFSGIHTPSFTLVAVKEIKLAERSNRHQTFRELLVLKQVQEEAEENFLPKMKSKFLVGYYGVYYDSELGSISLVLEMMDGGSLEDLLFGDKSLKKGLGSEMESEPYFCGIFDESILTAICYDMLMGLKFLSEINLLHLDIKPANVLLTRKGVAKIADFGLSKALSENNYANTFVGTMRYMSPERIAGKQYDFSSDIWSFGLTILTLVAGFYPLDLGTFQSQSFHNSTKQSGTAKEGNEEYWSMLTYFQDKEALPIPKTVSTKNGRKTVPSSIRKTIEASLQIFQDRRATAHKLLEGPFFRKNMHLERKHLVSLLETHNNLRGSAQSTLEEILRYSEQREEGVLTEKEIAALSEQLGLDSTLIEEKLGS